MIRPVAALLLVSLAAHAETCRFTGTTGCNGRLAVWADTTQVDDLLTLDVTVEFTIHAWMTDYRYLGQECESAPMWGSSAFAVKGGAVGPGPTLMAL